MKTLFLIVSIAFSSFAYGQQHTAHTYLFVPGAWDGGWDYSKVDSILSAQGDIVYRPTLTGLGERVHLANPGVNLTTYVNDILNLIRFENLHEVILVGHSYGGMVISGVAEQSLIGLNNWSIWTPWYPMTEKLLTALALNTRSHLAGCSRQRPVYHRWHSGRSSIDQLRLPDIHPQVKPHNLLIYPVCKCING